MDYDSVTLGGVFGGTSLNVGPSVLSDGSTLNVVPVYRLPCLPLCHFTLHRCGQALGDYRIVRDQSLLGRV